MAKPKIKRTITKKEWNKTHKDFKIMGKDGIPYIMAYDDKIGTHLVPVKIVDESVNENTYKLGDIEYTKKNMTPTQILDLAMAYSQVKGKGTTMWGNKMEKMINVGNDLAKLNGTTQQDAKKRGKPALILTLLKNKLVTKDEYIKLYKDLLSKQTSVVKALKNADPASRMVGGAAARAAHRDMKGHYDESINEGKVDTLKNAVQKINKNYKVQISKHPITKGEVEIILGRGNHPDKDYDAIQTLVSKLGIQNYSIFDESVNEGMFSTIDQIRQDSKDVKDFVKNVFKDSEFKKMSNDKDFIKYLKAVYTENIEEGDGYPHGLWANIRAKRARGEKPAHGNSKAHKDAVKAGEKINKNESVNEAYVVMYAKKKGEKPAAAAFQLRGSALSFEKDLKKDGYITMITQKKVKGVDESVVNEFKKLRNRSGDVDGLMVTHNGKEYELVYSADFTMGGAIQPYGIVMPGDDVVSFLGKDRKAKSIWKQLKPKVDKFLKSNESVNESDDVYHKSYTHAIEAAEVYAKKKGYEIDDDEMFTKVAMNSKRPSVGKTTKVSLELLKNGKPQKKMLHIQVYGMKNGYELNAYIN